MKGSALDVDIPQIGLKDALNKDIATFKTGKLAHVKEGRDRSAPAMVPGSTLRITTGRKDLYAQIAQGQNLRRVDAAGIRDRSAPSIQGKVRLARTDRRDFLDTVLGAAQDFYSAMANKLQQVKDQFVEGAADKRNSLSRDDLLADIKENRAQLTQLDRSSQRDRSQPFLPARRNEEVQKARGALLDDIAHQKKGQLQAAASVADRSSPFIAADTKVELHKFDRNQLLQDVVSHPALSHVQPTHDASKPQLPAADEKVDLAKNDRRPLLQEIKSAAPQFVQSAATAQL